MAAAVPEMDTRLRRNFRELVSASRKLPGAKGYWRAMVGHGERLLPRWLTHLARWKSSSLKARRLESPRCELAVLAGAYAAVAIVRQPEANTRTGRIVALLLLTPLLAVIHSA